MKKICRVVMVAMPIAWAAAAFAVDPRVGPLDAPVAGPIVEATMEVATEGITHADNLVQQAALNNWLRDALPAAVLDTPVRVELTQDQINSIEFPEPTNGEPLKVGLVVPVTSRLGLDGLSTPKRGTLKRDGQLSGGTLTRTADGGYVWAAAIRSENAGAIRVHVDNLWLPNNAELYFYNQRGEAYGPFTGGGPDGAAADGRGEFWTPSVFGAEGILQLHVTGKIDDADLQDISLRVTEVGHIGRGVFGLPGDAQGGVASFCPTNAECIINNDCVTEPIVDPNELAVAKMIWISGAFIYTCSGGLIADTDTSTQIPYFLTANHCLSKSNSNLEAFFKYQDACGSTANCTGTWDDPPPGSFSGKTVGCTVKATNKKGDFTLLQLSQNPPSGSVYLGWTTTPVANSEGVALYRVSHPSGAPQSYSDSTVNTTSGTCAGWPRGERIYANGGVGSFEGGSSGSPVVNASSQIVGQLTGTCGSQGCPVCDHTCKRQVDGAFAFYYSKVQPFLAP